MVRPSGYPPSLSSQIANSSLTWRAAIGRACPVPLRHWPIDEGRIWRNSVKHKNRFSEEYLYRTRLKGYAWCAVSPAVLNGFARIHLCTMQERLKSLSRAIILDLNTHLLEWLRTQKCEMAKDLRVLLFTSPRLTNGIEHQVVRGTEKNGEPARDQS